jgi:hypothetical protein
MYYLLSYLIEDEKKDVSLNGIIYNNEKEIVSEIFDNGKMLNSKEIKAPFTVILDEKESNIKNKIKKDKISIYVTDAGFLFLVSEKVQIFFGNLKFGNLQFFDVTIKSSTIEFSDYKILNIIDKIDCIDFSASDLKTFDNGDISSIENLVLDESKIPKGKELFLLAKRSTAIIVVHRNLKEAIEKEKITGFQFVNLENAWSLY